MEYWVPQEVGGGAEETQVCSCSFVLPDQKSAGAKMVAPLGITLSDLRERNL